MYTVYLIENTKNYKLYVGVTKRSVEKRWKKGHCQKSHNVSQFNKDIEKYGEESFDLMILEKTKSIKKARKLEKRYINRFQTYEFGYNKSKGGELGGEKKIFSDEEVIEIVNKYRAGESKSKLSKEYSVSTGIIAHWHVGSERSNLYSEFSGPEKMRPTALPDEEAVDAVIEYKTTSLSRREVANKYGICRQTLRRWEDGEQRVKLQDKITARFSYHYL